MKLALHAASDGLLFGGFLALEDFIAHVIELIAGFTFDHGRPNSGWYPDIGDRFAVEG